MRCPACRAKVSISPFCPQCGRPLGGDPVPLTSAQRKGLRGEFVHFGLLALAIAVLWTLMKLEILSPPDWMFWTWFVCIVLYCGYQALQLRHDLRSGIALTREDLLESVHPPSGKGGQHYHGQFAQLGSLRLGRGVDVKSPAGRRYRLVFSPASKIVWTLEAAETGAA